MYQNRTIEANNTLLDAFKKMDDLDKKLLIVLEDGIFIGLISAGDIQRAIIQNLPLNTPVSQILRKNIKIARPADSMEGIRQMMLDFRMELCPIVDKDNKITKVYFWEDMFSEKKPQPKFTFNLPVVIMAGGLGKRLRPLTNVLPKPLIPLKDKTIIEHIFDRFAQYGCSDFFISVNYKANLIKYYIEQQQLPYSLHFFIEDKPLGTVGSLSLIKDKINQTFFVSNCDILIEQDYSEILQYHRENGNDITIVAALKHIPIPYGTIVTSKNGKLEELKEKPEITFKVNSGMYILEPHLLNILPSNKFYHITELIEAVNKMSGKVGVFPVSEKSWKDIGEWQEYMNSIKHMQHE